MKVLIACEESQTICKAFRALGHEAYSNDILPCSGGHPEWHIQADVRTLLKDYFDLVVFHPVCRYIANSGVRWLYTEEGRFDKMVEACEFFNLRHEFNSPKVITENPVPHGYAVRGWVETNGEVKRMEHGHYIGEPDQCFQPWQHGEKQMKGTCLWFKGVGKLIPSNVVGPPPKDRMERLKWQDVWMASPGPERERLRSKTLNGPAMAIAQQYGSAA